MPFKKKVRVTVVQGRPIKVNGLPILILDVEFDVNHNTIYIVQQNVTVYKLYQEAKTWYWQSF